MQSIQKYILVTVNSDENNFTLNKAYINALFKNNLTPILVGYSTPFEKYRSNICGILLTGGGDLGTTLLKVPISPMANSIIDARDRFEKEVILSAVKYKIPMLAICRGAQVLNTVLGGNIKQHIPYHMQKEDRNQPTHYVKINKDSLLYDILDKEEIKVNSFHHQCVDKIAPDLRLSAIYEDKEDIKNNVIEALEYKDKNYFALALQWHPEALEDENCDKIFRYFARECNSF